MFFQSANKAGDDRRRTKGDDRRKKRAMTGRKKAPSDASGGRCGSQGKWQAGAAEIKSRWLGAAGFRGGAP